VAELGRPETPAETAERKAAASARRRANQTAFNLVIALLASLAVVAVIVLVVVRPQTVERDPVDYAAVAVDAQRQVDAPLAVPRLPEGWSANRAEFERVGDGISNWEIGFLTPSGEYIGFVQGVGADDRWVSDETAEAQATDLIEIDGTGWNVYDRRDVPDPGNLAYILVGTFDPSVVVLGGTASDEEFRVLAEAVSAQLGGDS
jgi:hypothetical protein